MRLEDVEQRQMSREQLPQGPGDGLAQRLLDLIQRRLLLLDFEFNDFSLRALRTRRF